MNDVRHPALIRVEQQALRIDQFGSRIELDMLAVTVYNAGERLLWPAGIPKNGSAQESDKVCILCGFLQCPSEEVKAWKPGALRVALRWVNLPAMCGSILGVAGLSLGASTCNLLIQLWVTEFDGAEHDYSSGRTRSSGPTAKFDEVLLAYRSGWSQPGCGAWIC
jgi:hypothetical protein